MEFSTIAELLGSNPSSSNINEFLANAESASKLENIASSRHLKWYREIVYFNYYQLGLSFQFNRRGLDEDPSSKKLSLDTVDLYNLTAPNGERKESFLPFKLLPLSLPSASGQTAFAITPLTRAQEFVTSLGEPERKGGGSGTLCIWCEWTRFGLMVEFGGDEAKGPGAWDSGKDAVWRVLSIFRPEVKAT